MSIKIGNHCEDLIDLTSRWVMLLLKMLIKIKVQYQDQAVYVLRTDSTSLAINDFSADNALSSQQEPDDINHGLGVVSFLVNIESGISKVV